MGCALKFLTTPLRHILPIHIVTINSNNLWISAGRSLLRWEIIWRNAPRICRDFGSALPFQTRLSQTKPVLPLSNEHGSQIKDQGRRQCCHISIKDFPIGLQVMYLYFPDTPRTNSLNVNSNTFFTSRICQPEKVLLPG
jgi:hypothetical protein